MLVLQKHTDVVGRSAGHPFGVHAIDNQTAQFDLSLYLRERAGKLIGFFEYTTDLFYSATIARMAGNFQNSIRGIAADPDLSIARLPMLGAAERQQLLFEWNDTRAEYHMAHVSTNCLKRRSNARRTRCRWSSSRRH
jgi:non-ribosomal peptide synthetase component F